MRRLAPLFRLLSLIGAVAVGVETLAAMPVVDGRPVVATVNGDNIWLRDVERELTNLHEMQGMGDRKVARQNPMKILDRMITARLLAQEARNIGLDELPEAQAEFVKIRLETARDLLTREAVKNVKADPAVVETVYRDTVVEYRVRSILVPNEKDAKDLESKLKAKGDFDALASALVKGGKAQEASASDWLKAREVQPQAAAVMKKLKPGQVSPAVKLDAGWAFFRLLEARYPESPEARQMAEATALAEARDASLSKYTEGLRKRHAVVDEKVFASVDFEKEGAAATLAKDARTLATIQGAAPVTVADFYRAMDKRFYHGIEKAIDAKKVNKEKRPVLEDLLNRRVVPAEATRLGLDKGREFEDVIERKNNAYLFGAVVQKVILPELKIERKDLEEYLKAHQSEYMSPDMVEIDSLAFDRREDAEDALAKLQRGADFDWIRKNATGQTDRTKTPGMQSGLFVTATLAGDLQKALVGTRTGDYRYYGEPKGPYYVVHVLRHEVAKPQTLDLIEEKIAKAVYQEKMGQLVDDWGEKLRKASEIEVFATGDEILKAVLQDLSAN